jgi:uncharacterized membrane protein YtjA (UPF0391 family)
MILGWAISFSLFALVAAALGFSHAAASTSVIAKVCFALFALFSLVRVRSAGGWRTRATADVIGSLLARAGVGESLGRLTSERSTSAARWRSGAGLASLHDLGRGATGPAGPMGEAGWPSRS